MERLIKLTIIMFLCINSNAQGIKLFEHFSYDVANSQYNNKWINYNMDSSSGSTGFISWSIYYKDKAGMSILIYAQSGNRTYDIKGKNLDTSGIVTSSSGNPNKKLLDDWTVYRVQLNLNSLDSIGFLAGSKVSDEQFPIGLGGYKPDTLEVWLSDKQLTTEPSNMNIFVGYAIINDTFPIWQRFVFPLNGILSQNKMVYLGIRHIVKEAYVKTNPAIWLDDVYVGNNPSRDLATKTEDLVVKTGLKVYPNPAKDKLNIEFKNNAEKGEIKVFNIFGQVVISQNVQVAVNGIHELNVETLPKGIYFLQYGSKNQKTVSSKFVKE